MGTGFTQLGLPIRLVCVHGNSLVCARRVPHSRLPRLLYVPKREEKKTIRGVGGLHGLREHRVGPVAPACTWDVSSLESASTWDRTFSHSFFLSFQFVFYFSRFYFLFLLSCSTLSISLFLFFSFFSSVNISSRTSMYIFFVLFFSRVVFLPYYFIFILPFFSFLMLFFFHVKLSIHDVYFSSFLYFFFVDFIFSIFYLILFTCIFFI